MMFLDHLKVISSASCCRKKLEGSEGSEGSTLLS